MPETGQNGGVAEIDATAAEKYLRLHRSFESAKAVEHVGRVQEAIGIVHRAVDDAFRDEGFAEVDQLLAHVDIGRESVDMLLSLLTATLPARNRLSSRPDFYSHVEDGLRSRGVLEPGLLDGLQ